jgi:hypothetical protein
VAPAKIAARLSRRAVGATGDATTTAIAVSQNGHVVADTST